MAYSNTRTEAGLAMVPVRNEIQLLTISGTPTGGNFNITFSGQTTANIAYNAANSAIDSALEALSNIPAGGVTCSGAVLPAGTITVEFTGDLASTNVAAMTCNSANLTGGTTPTASVAVSQTGYGAEKVAIDAGIDALGAIVDTMVTDAALSQAEAEELYEMLYAFAEKCGLALRDEIT